ncbi:MAG: YjjG family noncanonical pyrimidine nucleotidase [Lachnospiraceae bacterium]|nr:YjjG family noncanonical pyrimidine nucleotidase [Lachnospiraceae bacterium]
MEHTGKYEILLLDVDGTLLDFNASERMGITQVLLSYGISPSEELLSRYHELNDRFWQAFNRGEISKEKLLTERFRLFFGELGREVDGEEAEARYRSQLDESAILIPGALETCRILSGRYDCYVVTNGSSKTQYKRLALSGLDRFMKDVFVSEMAGSQKPRKEYFDYCFARIEAERQEPVCRPRTLIVGDSLHSDILGGNLAGIRTCWVNPEGNPPEEGIAIDYEIRNVAELLEIL